MKSLLCGLALLPLITLGVACSGGGGGGDNPDAGDGGSGGGDGGTCTTSSTGSVTVTIAGLPSGVNASVNLVSGSSSQNVTQTTTLNSVASGTYTVSADIVTQADP
ncbi:MAG: hypothetical protein ACRELY_27105, partial [Polyangiaceae bacterium]